MNMGAAILYLSGMLFTIGFVSHKQKGVSMFGWFLYLLFWPMVIGLALKDIYLATVGKEPPL